MRIKGKDNEKRIQKEKECVSKEWMRKVEKNIEVNDIT
jgi:hypothetical protein